jgi:acyl-CoA synthetase (NDP forming)
VPEFAGVRADEARALVRGFLDSREETPRVAPLLLPPATTADLLSCYGIPLAGPGAAGAVGGIEVMIRVADDRVFGPLVVFGLGGAAAEIAADRAARLTPLTDADADKLIRSIRSAPLLQAQAGLAGLRDLLLRVSRLADDLPEVTALVLDPVIAAPDRVTVASARAEVAPYEPADPYLRKLR